MTVRVAVHESDFQARVAQALNAPGRQTRLWRQSSGRVKLEGNFYLQLAPAGAADLTGVVTKNGIAAPGAVTNAIGDGWRLEVEVKSATAVWNKDQQHWAALMQRWGAIYVLVRYDEARSLDENVLAAVAAVDAAIADRRMADKDAVAAIDNMRKACAAAYAPVSVALRKRMRYDNKPCFVVAGTTDRLTCEQVADEIENGIPRSVALAEDVIGASLRHVMLRGAPPEPKKGEPCA